MAGSSVFRLVAVVGGALVVAATVAGVVLAAQLVTQGKTASAAPAHVQPPTPSAADVADQLAGVANARFAATADGGRLSHVSCLQGSPGSYACSYVRTVPARGSSCAVAILRWTPTADSTYTVRTAGRVRLAPRECGPVRKVLHVLGTSG